MILRPTRHDRQPRWTPDYVTCLQVRETLGASCRPAISSHHFLYEGPDLKSRFGTTMIGFRGGCQLSLRLSVKKSQASRIQLIASYEVRLTTLSTPVDFNRRMSRAQYLPMSYSWASFLRHRHRNLGSSRSVEQGRSCCWA